MRPNVASQRHWHPADSQISEAPHSAPNRIEWLIDNSEAYESLVHAIGGARESIWISQLAFDADCRVYAGDNTRSGADTRGESLLAAILAASEQHRVSVKILLNSTLLLNTRRPLLRSLSERKIDPELVEVRGISRFPQLLHAKMVIVDGRRAFIIGSPFVNGYWDTPSHHPLDARRPPRELSGRPVHDVSMGVRGPAVRDLAERFARLWNGARDVGPRLGTSPIKAHSVNRTAAEPGVEVVTTEPRGGWRSDDPGSSDTLDALLAGIQRARSLIYIEHQYLSSRPVAKELRRALEREPALEIILLLNQNPDVTAYRRWQNARLADAGLRTHPRVGVFALWTAAPRTEAGLLINQVFVHSKVVIVDDEWAMVGSANLDGASLDSYGDDFTGRLARRIFRNVRNFDVSLVFTSANPTGAANPIRQLRERLWTEHLGLGLLSLEGRERDGLTVWKRRGSENVSALNSQRWNEGTAIGRSFILPYSSRPTPRAQLAEVGVRPSTPISLDFDPGWLEVNFSPNWIRNMFL